jgi:hypothetical protein
VAIPAKDSFGGGVLVPQPPVGSIRYGLFTVAPQHPMPPHGDIGGITYEQEHCGTGFLWEGPLCSPTATQKTFGTCDGLAYGGLFTIGAGKQWGPIGHSEEEFERRLRVQLQDNSQIEVEQAFWGGRTAPTVSDVLTTSGLTINDLTPTPGTACSLERGVGILEEFLSSYSYPGIFHARPIVSPYATERLLSVPDGKPGLGQNRYRTPMGNVWSFGRGYSGNKPSDNSVPPAGAGGADATAYIVATGPVNLWAGDVYSIPFRGGLDRTANQLYKLAEQVWAATIDCLAAYVLVNLTPQTT